MVLSDVRWHTTASVPLEVVPEREVAAAALTRTWIAEEVDTIHAQSLGESIGEEDRRMPASLNLGRVAD